MLRLQIVLRLQDATVETHDPVRYQYGLVHLVIAERKVNVVAVVLRSESDIGTVASI